MTNPNAAFAALNEEDKRAMSNEELYQATLAKINRPIAWQPSDRPLPAAIQAGIDDAAKQASIDNEADFHEAHALIERKRARLGLDMAHPRPEDSGAILEVRDILAGMGRKA